MSWIFPTSENTPAPRLPYRLLVDEDLSYRVAETSRGLGLDAVSVHEIGRLELDDDEQLRWAAGQQRIVVTRNRDDYIEWTTIFFQLGEPHAGVLIVPTPLSIQRSEMARGVRTPHHPAACPSTRDSVAPQKTRRAASHSTAW